MPMTQAEAKQMLARSKELLPMIEAANETGDRETLNLLADQYAREVGLPLFLRVIEDRP